MPEVAVQLENYELLCRVARSSTGEVWRARHAERGFEAAIKVAAPTASPVARALMEAEILALAQLDHPHVVRVYAQGIVDETASVLSDQALPLGARWYAMEWISGGTLLEHRTGLDWTTLSRVLQQLLGALAHAHARGIVHRDIKPGNILVDGAGDIRLTDFGMATTSTARAVVVDGGTPAYMAPEQFEGDESLQGPWSDLYQVGVVAWACVTGTLPFVDESWEALEHAHRSADLPEFIPLFPVPGKLRAWLGKLLRKPPSRRFRFAADAARALQRLGPMSVRTTNPTLIAADDDAPRPVRPRSAGIGGPSCSMLGLRPIPLVGRRRHRSALWRLLREVNESRRPRVVLLDGERGSGKSCLAQWIAVSAHEQGRADWVCATHDATGGARNGLAGMVERALRVSTLSEDEVRQSLGEQPVDGASLAAWLAPRAGVEVPDRSQRYALTTRVLSQLCADRPVVAWLDDAHLDLETLGFVEFLLDHTDALPLLAVLTVVDEAVRESADAMHRLRALSMRGDVERIRVGSLSTQSWQRIFCEGLGLSHALTARLEGRCVRDIVMATDLVRDWAERGVLHDTPDGLSNTGPLELVLPARLVETWRGRVEEALVGWSDDQQRVVELAAVLGSQPDGDEWSDACVLAGLPLPHTMTAELLSSGLLRPGRHGWVFGHKMVREALLQRGRDSGRQPMLHTACAAALEGRRDRTAALRRARHLLTAGDADRAAPELLAVSRRLQRAGALREAEAALGDWAETMMGRAPSPDDDVLLDGVLLLAENLCAQGRLDEASEASCRALELSRASDAQQARALGAIGRVELERGQLATACSSLKAAIDGATLAGDVETLAGAATSLGLARVALGDFKAGVSSLRLVLSMAKERRDPWAESKAALGLAHALIQVDLLDEASALVSRARVLVRATRASTDAAHCAHVTGDLLRAQGDAAAAVNQYERAWRDYGRAGALRALWSRVSLALCLIRLGRGAEGRRHLLAVLQESLPQPSPTLAQALCHLGLCVVRHEHDSWSHHWGQAREALSTTGFVARDVATLTESVAVAAAEEGRHDQEGKAWLLVASQWKTLGDDEAAAAAEVAAADGR